MIKAKRERLYRDVDFLCAIRPYRNYKNLDSLEKASSYISGEFASHGYKPVEQLWEAEGNEYKNIIASYREEKERRLIVGAHYDVAGDQEGADDNASAVAGLLETARLVSENQPALDYGIDFVAYNLEEVPFFTTEKMGSFIHAKSLYESGVNVRGMICYEMIGYFSDEPGSQKFPSEEVARMYPDTGNYIVVVGIEKCREFNARFFGLMTECAEIAVERIDFPDSNELAARSDQRNYWTFGYDALMINDTSFMRNPNYHLASDTIDTLDFDKMTGVVSSCYHAITNLDP
ncbi:MAG: M28 family peptidase [Bacteroidota bacterium]|nr:M28 family peptidase [Bacteroidota bacterium]